MMASVSPKNQRRYDVVLQHLIQNETYNFIKEYHSDDFKVTYLVGFRRKSGRNKIVWIYCLFYFRFRGNIEITLAWKENLILVGEDT